MSVHVGTKDDLAIPVNLHLDLRVLGQFMVVAETLNMTAAARRMGLSTPAVSQIVLRLERELGATFFERNPHGLRLTPAGVLLRERARTLMECETATIQELAAYKGRLIPKLRVYLIESMAVFLTRAIVAELTPFVRELEVQTGRQLTFIRDFLRDEIDLVVSNEPLEEIPNLERHRVCRQKLVGLVPAALPLERRDLRQLAEELPLLRFRQGGRMDQAVQEYLDAHGIDAPRRIECGSPGAMAELVDAGLGWTITQPLAISWLQPRMTHVDWLPLPPPVPTRDIFLIGGAGRFLDLPETLAKHCRAALQQEVGTWLGTAAASGLSAVAIDRAA